MLRIIRHCLFLVITAALGISTISQAQTLIINEVSNGPTGNQEFVEFVVADDGLAYDCGSNVPPCIDIRGWIFDDNSGYHGTGGIAEGALRFSNAPLWSCVPLGTIILLYNDADPNVNLPPVDLSTSDGNCSIVAPISNTSLFEQNLTTPGAAACSYPTTGWIAGGNWEYTFLANSGDCARLVDLSGCEVFSLCWASCSSNSLIYFDSNGSGSQNVWFFNDGDPTQQSSWSEGTTTGSTNETPGAPNNTANAAFIGQFNNNCTPITPIEVTANATPTNCGCTGTANATATGSVGGYTFVWTDATYIPIGQNTASATGLCAGTYRVIATSGIGCPDTASVTITATGGGTINVTETVSACANTTVTYPDGTTELILIPTSHVSQFTLPSGCDSVITTTVQVVTFLTSTDIELVCANTTVTYPDGTSELITGSTTHISNLMASTGCDSVVTTVVTLIPNFSSTETVSVCANTSVTYPDGTTETVLANTSHISNLTSIIGCDSIVTTTVTIGQGYNGQEAATVCPNTTYTYPDGSSEVIASATTHVSVFPTSAGCDSIITTTITLLSGQLVQEAVEICSGNSYTFPDGSLVNDVIRNTTYQSVFPTASGCDSIVETTLLVTAPQGPSFSFLPRNPGPFELETTFEIEEPGSGEYEWSLFNSDSALIYTSTDTTFTFTFPNVPETYHICVLGSWSTGCSTTACKPIKVETNITVYVPNAFTPEQDAALDQLNDVFKPVIGGAIVSTYELFIFDRWGKQVFTSTDHTLGWDGLLNGRMVPTGLYVYRFSFTTQGLTFLHQYNGQVVVLR